VIYQDGAFTIIGTRVHEHVDLGDSLFTYFGLVVLEEEGDAVACWYT
jgi:hypothetical protein